MNSFILKILACISMFFDHSGYILFGGFSYFNYIGRLAFPLFAFQLIQGYLHTRSKQSYFFRLLIFALISQIPFSLFYSLLSKEFLFNIMFTLLLGFILLYILDNTKLIVGLLFTIIATTAAQLLPFDYGYYGILLIAIFYLFRNKKFIMVLLGILLTIIKYAIQIIQGNHLIYCINLALYTCIPILLLLIYNNKQGQKTKYFFYIFYPCHLLFLYLLNFYI